jgi:hypothetical protein
MNRRDLPSGLRLRGAVELRLYRANGEIVVRRKDNLIVDVGFDFIADVIGLSSGRPGAMSHIAVGTGVVAAAAGDTALGAELARKAAAYAHTAGTKVFTVETTFDPGEATGAITEAGVFNAATAGTMLDRVVFAVINKGADDTLTQKFTFTMS